MNKVQRLEQYLSELETYLVKSRAEAIALALRSLRLREVVLLYVGARKYPIVADRLKKEFGIDLEDHDLQGLFDTGPRSSRGCLQEGCFFGVGSLDGQKQRCLGTFSNVTEKK